MAVINFTTAMAAASAANATSLATAASELSANTVAPDPLVTLQLLANLANLLKTGAANETLARAQGDIAVAAYAGQSAIGDNAPDYSSGAQLPVNAGDALVIAITKLLNQANKHPVSPGIILPYWGSPSAVPSLDLPAGDDPTASVGSNTGPFWVVMDGTTHNGVVTVNLAGQTLMGAGANSVGLGSLTGSPNIWLWSTLSDPVTSTGGNTNTPEYDPRAAIMSSGGGVNTGPYSFKQDLSWVDSQADSSNRPTPYFGPTSNNICSIIPPNMGVTFILRTPRQFYS